VRRKIVRVASIGWRALLVVAIVSLALAALATVSGNDALSRTFGTIAWSTAFAGSVSGLLAGAGSRVPA
jgi:hypothetical protein